MFKSILIGVILMLSQIILSQDNRQIKIFYCRMFGCLIIESVIKYDNKTYKILSKVTQCNDKKEIVKTDNEIEITKNEFNKYFLILNKYNESDNTVSYTEEDNQLDINIENGTNKIKVRLMPVLKYMKTIYAYKELLPFLECLFLRIGVLPKYLYNDR